jgi:predicted nucleic-acid-binding Zn-ribbon protein
MPIEPQVGTWYIVVTCAECKSTLYLFRDLTEGKGSLNASYTVTCPRCRHKGQYEAQHRRETGGSIEAF